MGGCLECEVMWSGNLCGVGTCVEWEVVWSGRLCGVGGCMERENVSSEKHAAYQMSANLKQN